MKYIILFVVIVLMLLIIIAQPTSAIQTTGKSHADKLLQISPETFYPSLDGYVDHFQTNQTWATIHDAAGNTADNVSAYSGTVQIVSTSTTNTWSAIVRSIYLFDTSALPDNAIISSATFSVYGGDKVDQGSWSPTMNIYSVNPSSNTSLTATDYATFGTTTYCDAAITYANMNAAGYNNFTLNSTGLSNISKTGITKIGLREATYDVANSAPTYVASKQFYFRGYYSEQGAGYQPKLVVTYTTPTGYSYGTIIGKK
jgi:hypothetical protein